MSLLETLRIDMKTAIKAGNTDIVQILKIVLATIQNAQISSDKELTDTDIQKILRKETNKIEDSISQYSKMGRKDLVKSEKKDLEIMRKYLPELMNDKEIKEVVSKKITQLGVKDIKEIGKVMGVVMKELNGKADGNSVRNIVQEMLNNG
ncbi:TPA: aspartyl-tRNA amidotransferase [Patescibacteria group bacterium]|nr:aspartyl-tRNA amidotransferase [Patescibacteria group bacterium]